MLYHIASYLPPPTMSEQLYIWSLFSQTDSNLWSIQWWSQPARDFRLAIIVGRSNCSSQDPVCVKIIGIWLKQCREYEWSILVYEYNFSSWDRDKRWAPPRHFSPASLPHILGLVQSITVPGSLEHIHWVSTTSSKAFIINIIAGGQLQVISWKISGQNWNMLWRKTCCKSLWSWLIILREPFNTVYFLE